MKIILVLIMFFGSYKIEAQNVVLCNHQTAECLLNLPNAIVNDKVKITDGKSQFVATGVVHRCPKESLCFAKIMKTDIKIIKSGYPVKLQNRPNAQKPILSTAKTSI